MIHRVGATVLLAATLLVTRTHAVHVVHASSNGNAAGAALTRKVGTTTMTPSSCRGEPPRPLFGYWKASSSSRSRSRSSITSSLSVRGGGGGDGGNIMEPANMDDMQALVTAAGLAQKLVVIDFSAKWCQPCQAIAPLFAELSTSVDNVVFVKVDVDDVPDVAAHYNVSAMPTFVFIKQGEVVDRLMGANGERLQELIDENK